VNTQRSTIRCGGCGWVAAAAEAYPFRCPHANGDDVDHVLVRVLDTTALRFPDGSEPDPFARYRALMHSYHLATDAGLDDDEYLQLIAALERSVAAVDGHGFQVTPMHRNALLSDRLRFSDAGGVWVKDETRNVSGSHKGRHLMGLLIHLEVAERLGLTPPGRSTLAIASCGNAALAAAVVARAGGRPLRVFVPADADAGIVARLRQLGSDVVACPREPGVAGDPAYLRLREELAAGAVPFTCQGNENGLAIEGGETIAYEIASDLAGLPLDHVVIQVGGGALARACAQGLHEAAELGAITSEPRLHTVQTTGGHPLERAYTRVRALLAGGGAGQRDDAGRMRRADVERALASAARHRSAYMWPWESEPKSIAAGILDDETYDWRAVVGAMLATGGRPLVVTEERLAEASDLGAATGIPVDPTGSSGLAGLLDLRQSGVVGPDERVAVLFTGVRRD